MNDTPSTNSTDSSKPVTVVTGVAAVEADNNSNDTPTSNSTVTSGRAFTFKSVILGVLGLLFTIGYTDFNDFYLSQTSFVSNFLPPGPIFLVLAVAVIWNPLWQNRLLLLFSGLGLCIFIAFYLHFGLHRPALLSAHWLLLLPFIVSAITPIWQKIAQKMVLNSRELLVTLIIIFVGCWTAGAGLNRSFTHVQIIPWVYYANNPQLHKYETIDYIPQHLWPAGGFKAIGNDTQEKQRVYDAFTTGYEEQGTNEIPWDAWVTPILSSWFPLLAFFSIALISLSLIVHRQWAHHEQLSYPIAQIGTALFEKTASRKLPDIFYSRMFWGAASAVIFFHGIRLLHTWLPNNFPDISQSVSFVFFWDLFPIASKSGAFWLNNFSFFFSIIGICYFLSREIGLTIGVSHVVLFLLSAQVYLATGTGISSDDNGNMRAGAYLAYAGVILFTGRNYYFTILKKAFTFEAADETEADGVFAARVLMVSFIGLITVLCVMFQLELIVAIVFTLLSMLLFLVFTRIICETGIPYLQVGWSPPLLITKIFGASAIGAAPIVIMYYIGAVLFSDPKEAMMPYISNSFKMADTYKLKLKRLCVVIISVASIAILVSISARIFQHYTIGSNLSKDTYGSYHVPKGILDNATRDLTRLDDMGQRTPPGQDSQFSIFERIGMIQVDQKTIIYVLAGAACVVLFFGLRFRFAGFPLHPVMFLIWGTYPISKTFYSFLIGWGIREMIVRFGGGKVYQNCKPFFIGLIFGELLMGITGLSTGLLYYLFSHRIPPEFQVFVS